MERLITKSEILHNLQDKRQDLLVFGVLEIGLFGSFLTNNANLDSDIDLLVDIKKDRKTFKNFMSLNYFLENLFGRKVDLVTKQSLSPFIGPHILNSVEYVTFSS
ncbi:nucleotidyltransferase [Pedobacter yonginense]|uniref:Nucleotidyltransferase n=1 Tax=Pedobacter yonginense TaxID=651869 RepID=A0A317ER05_9SPHI|nr:nucleotidyltransferase family protein [Pedobacter yonginense]PWS29114.1 nucleotidyltransferase [Pedobacter yonginense]